LGHFRTIEPQAIRVASELHVLKNPHARLPRAIGIELRVKGIALDVSRDGQSIS
jgi:hypothetical protein